MKIVCDACATRYSIADEKVRGKGVRMRCRRCSQVIVVRPDPGRGEARAAEDDAPRWHLALEGAQPGPLTPAEVRDRLGAGEATGETYAWREGMGDWQRLHAVPELAGLLPATAPAAEAPEGTPEEAAEEAPPGEEEAGALAPAPAGGAARSPALVLAPPPADASDGARMTAQRNEDSFLFSLDTLQALTARPADARPGHVAAIGMSSGLIDIRSLAAQTLASTRREEPAAPPGLGGELLFSPVLAAPVLVPAPPRGMPGWAWGAAAGLVALLAATTVSLRSLLRSSPASVAPAVLAANGPPRAEPPLAPLPPVAPVAAAGDAGPAQDPTSGPGGDRRVPGKARPAPAGRRRAVPATVAAADPAPARTAPAADPPPPRTAPRRPADDDPLTALLNQASPDPAADRRAGDRRAPEADLPEQLQRADILAGMRAVQPQVDACFDRYQLGGTALASVVLAGSGKAQSVRVAGALAGTPSGECVEKALRSASFRRFRGAPMSLQFPFILRQK